MLDLQLLRKRLDWVAERLLTRGTTAWIEEGRATEHSPHSKATFEALENQRKAIQIRTQELQTQRNALSKQIGQAKSKGEDVVRADGRSRQHRQPAQEERGRARGSAQRASNAFVARCPTSRTTAVPAGSPPTTTSKSGGWASRATSISRCKDHVDLGERLGHARFRGCDQDRRRALHAAQGPDGAPASRHRAVHAGCAYRRARLHRSLRALPGERREPARHGPAAEVRGRSVRRAAPRRREAVPDSRPPKCRSPISCATRSCRSSSCR